MTFDWCSFFLDCYDSRTLCVVASVLQAASPELHDRNEVLHGRSGVSDASLNDMRLLARLLGIFAVCSANPLLSLFSMPPERVREAEGGETVPQGVAVLSVAQTRLDQAAADVHDSQR